MRISGVRFTTPRGKRKAGHTPGRDCARPETSAATGIGIRRCRTEYARRAALVEIDALVAVWLGLEIEEFLAAYESRFSVLADHEDDMYFDANGRKLAADYDSWGHGQTKEHWKQFEKYLEDPAAEPAAGRVRGALLQGRIGSRSTDRRMRCSVSGCGRRGRTVACGETDAGRGRTEDEPNPVPVNDVRARGPAGTGGIGEVP